MIALATSPDALLLRSAPSVLTAEVAVPVPLAHAFTYEVPPALAERVRPGARVACPFGPRRVVGVVLNVGNRPPPPGVELRALGAVVDPDPVLPEELLSFLLELASYYMAPIGEVLRLALPAIERGQVRRLASEGQLSLHQKTGARQVGGRLVSYVRPTDAIEEPGTLRGKASAVLALLRAGGEQSISHLERQLGSVRDAVRRLEKLGLVAIDKREVPHQAFFTEAAAPERPPVLTPAQAEAAARIEEALTADGSAARAFLLFGVTGSGKTEVYLRAIEACKARGRGALVLVPEIALTPQLVARFRARFGDDVAVLHSALDERDRHAMWMRLRRGEVRVAIGARSALFAPVPDLGLVVVDEEHDASFKQEEGVRYHARDMAILRAHRAGATIVLGSATPSLESIQLVRRGRLVQLDLPERAHREATLPEVELVDLRRIGPGPTGDRLLSLPLYREIERTLERNEQAILFLNRRGFAPSVVCASCGRVEMCPLCSVALTYHRARGGSVRCHYCDHEAPLPEACTSCGAKALELEGVGTERLEQTVAAAFPNARVERLDRDVADGARAEAILARMRRGEIDVLVGTQMVTKGHDLPNVTLVGVVNADAALSLPDFRASERAFQLLVQVAGRAGRRDRPGRVIVQTRSPDHPAIAFAARHDVPGFLERELADRREVRYPPFVRLALVRVESMNEHAARTAAGRMAAAARTSPEGLARRVEVLGPSPAPIARLRGRWRFRVLLRAPERPSLRAALAVVERVRHDEPRTVRSTIDVDPVGML